MRSLVFIALAYLVSITGVIGSTSSFVPPADRIVLVGQPITMTMHPVGAPPMAFQWLRNGRPINGATDTTLTIPSATVFDAGSYTFRVDSERGSATSEAVLVGVLDMQTQTISTFAGKPVEIECKAESARSSPYRLSYQWFKDGVPLTGEEASLPKLSLNRVEANQAGDYTCQLKLRNATFMSPAITLSIIGVPVVKSGFEDPNWMVNRYFVDHLTVESALPVRFAAQGLPPGVKLDPTTGEVFGTPTQAGTYRVRVSVTNAAGRGQVFDQVVTVKPWPAEFVGARYGGLIWYEDIGSYSPVIGDWTLIGMPNGTYTAKLHMFSNDIVVGKDKESGAPLRGRMKTESFTGTFGYMSESDRSFSAVGRVSSQGGEELVVVIRASGGGRTYAQVMKTTSDKKIAFGWATGRPLRSLSSPYVGSYVIARNQAPGNPYVTPSGMSFSAKLSAGATMSWVLNLGPEYNSMVASGSCPVMEGQRPWTFASCALPTPEGGLPVGISNKVKVSRQDVMGLEGQIAWPVSTDPNMRHEFVAFDFWSPKAQ